MSLTEREKDIALECFAQFNKPMGIDVDRMFDLFLSRIREEHEAVAYEVTQRHPKLEVYFAKWFKPHNVSPEDMAEYELSYIPLFTTPPAAPCDCSELVEALNKVMPACVCANQARRILANHAKRMKE